MKKMKDRMHTGELYLPGDFTLVSRKSPRSMSVRDARTSTICSTSLPLMVQRHAGFHHDRRGDSGEREGIYR